MLSDGAAGAAGEQTTIDFACEHCDAAVSAPVADAGKRIPCPECRRILKVPAATKPDPSNWRKADRHLPSAAKAPDEPAPEGAWGNLTRTVVSREALEEADAIPDTPEPVSLRERISFWTRVAVGAICVMAVSVYTYRWFSANREQAAVHAAVAFAANPDTVKRFGPERVGALHTLAGTYYIRTQVPYSDAPLAPERGSGEQARDEFDRALRVLQDADPRSIDRDFALGDLALAMVELAGDKDEQRDKMRTTWEDCLRHVRAALGAIRTSETKLEAYRAIARRLFERGQHEGALSLSSTAFSDTPAEKAAARATGLLEWLDRGGDKSQIEKACDEILKEYAVKEPPPLMAPVVALTYVLDKTPPAPGKVVDDQENSGIGEAEAFVRKGQLPQGRERANAAPSKTLRLRSLLAIGSVSKQGADDLSAACRIVLEGVDDPARDCLIVLRLIRVGLRAGVPDSLLDKVADAIVVPAVRSRAKLELLQAKLKQAKEMVAPELADSVDPQTPAGGLARAELARHNARYDRGYIRTAESWPEPLGAYGVLGAMLGTQKDSE
jgi:hypothetical protein